MVFFISVCQAALQEKSEPLFFSVVWKDKAPGCEILSTRSVMVWQDLKFNKQLARQCLWNILHGVPGLLTVLVIHSANKFPAVLNIWQLRSLTTAFFYYSISM